MGAEDVAVEIRRAGAGDAAVLAELGAQTFRDTFAELNEPGDIAAYLQDSFAPGRVAAELAGPANTFLLAVAPETGSPIGYAKLRAGAPAPAVRGPAPIEIERLYVDREAIGRGVGAALMRACLDEAARGRYRTVWLGVWERNPRAIEFYRRWGFDEVGEHAFLLGSDRQRDVVMERPVEADRREPGA